MPRSLAFRSAILFVLGSVLPRPAIAIWPHDPLVNLPICTASGEQFLSHFIPDGAGGAFATWQDYRAGNSDVYAQHVLASGVVDPAWPANGRAVCTHVAEQFNPVLVADNAGGIIVIWTDYRSGVSVPDIYAQRVLASGQIDPAWPATQLPVCTAGNEQSSPLAVSDGQGGAIVAWQDKRSTVYDIYAQRVRVTGSVDPAWPADGRALTTATGSQYAHAVVSDGAGGMIVVWQDTRNVNIDVFAQRILASGVVDPAWPVNGRGVCVVAGDQTNVVCTADGTGGAIIAWEDERVAQDFDIYVHHVSNSGVLDPGWGLAAGHGLCLDVADQHTPCIASDGAGGAIVAWADGRQNRIYAARVLSTGTNDPQWTVDGVVLCPTGPVQSDPACIADGMGGAFVTWAHFGGSSDLDIHGQHVMGNAATDPYVPLSGVPVCTHTEVQDNPFIVPDGTGGFLIAWNDQRTSSARDLYAQRVAPFGKLGNPGGSLLSVRDVPNDQGGQVLLEWTASYLDAFPTFPIDRYSVWRRVATAPAWVSEPAASSGPRRWRESWDGVTTLYWEWIAEQPARGRPGYSCVVPTTSDSNTVANPLTDFMVSAEYPDGVPYWDTAPLSGYSVDNLPPATPSPFTGQYAAGTSTLQWGANHEADFLEYRLYRGGSPNFVPASFTLVTTQSGTGYTDPAGAGFYYKLAAVDIHGNVSGYALLLPNGATVDVTPNPVAAFALSPPTPNPARDWTELRLALPAAGRISLALLDAAGRSVRTTLVEDLGSGDQALRVPLTGADGRALAAGLYFLRVESGPHVRVARLAIVR